jgi:hypothetical protein
MLLWTALSGNCNFTTDWRKPLMHFVISQLALVGQNELGIIIYCVALW